MYVMLIVGYVMILIFKLEKGKMKEIQIYVK